MEETVQENWKPATFDVDKFARSFREADEITVLVRGLLYIENIIIQIIAAGLPRKSAFKIDALSFAAKVDLAIAIGGLVEGFGETLKFINSIRNKVAHNLEIEIDNKIRDALFQKLSNDMQDHCGKFCVAIDPKFKHTPKSMFVVLTIIVVDLDLSLSRFISFLDKKKLAEERLRKAVDAVTMTVLSTMVQQSPPKPSEQKTRARSRSSRKKIGPTRHKQKPARTR